jgi:rubrerythrin
VVKDNPNPPGFSDKPPHYMPPKVALSYKEILLIGLKKEEESIQLYTDLAGTTSDAHSKEILLALAREEAGHKLQFQKALDFLSHIT